MKFQCQQLNALMSLGYTEDFEMTRLIHMRNATIPIGCVCGMFYGYNYEATLTQHFVET